MAEVVTYAEHLLPANASQLEKVLAGAGARTQTIPVPIDTIKRPDQTPTAFLPFLAWELSTDIWIDDWPETRKRVVASRSLALHRKKGTAYALREYARYVDAEITEIIKPPQKVFSGPSLTKAQREAWLSALPQVRVWRIRESGAAPLRKAFHGSSRSLHQHDRRFCLKGAMPTSSTALSRLRRRARWMVNGVETDITVAEFGSYFRLLMPSAARLRVFSNRPLRRGRFFVPSDAWRRVVTIMPTTLMPWRVPVGPTLQAVLSEPERVTVAGKRGRSVFCGVPAAGYFVPSSSALRVYQRYPVLDGTREVRRPACQIMGVGRYGWPKHTARVTASLFSERSRRAAGEGIVAQRRKFWIPHDPTPVRRLKWALQSAKRLSDKIWLKTGPQPTFVVGGPPVLSDAGTDVVVGRP